MPKTKYLAIALVTCLSANAYADNIKGSTPEVTAYYLSDSKGQTYADLDALKSIIDKIKSEHGTNFNKLVLSFVQPSLMNYQQGSLACTGLFGYFCDRADRNTITEQHNNPVAKEDFDTLKSYIKQLHDLGVDTYLAVGGWNFSCDPVLYPKSLEAMSLSGACGPKDAFYDTFPNPGTPAPFDDKANTKEAKLAYENLVKLTNDLGAAGIDLDYEEFWHADLNSFQWKVPDTYAAKQLAEKYPNRDIPYDVLLANFGNEAAYQNGHINPGNPGVMPDTVEKFGAIIKTIHSDIQQINPNLKISAALPAVGATPIMMSKWGLDPNTTYDVGAPWYHGNLKGLMYELAHKDLATANMLDSMAVMSYDLSKKDGQYIGGSDLAHQVSFYMHEYQNWLKSPSPRKATVDSSGIIKPAKYDLKGKLSFGFEVGKPGYPQDDTQALYLTKDDVSKMLNDMKSITDGMIMWDILKDQRYDRSYIGKWDDNWATPTDVLQSTCNAFNLSNQSNLYNCQANVPGNSNQQQDVNWGQPNLTVQDITSSSANLHWDKATAGSSPINYQISLNGQIIGDTKNTAYQLTNLNAASTYAVTVSAQAVGYKAKQASTNLTTKASQGTLSWESPNVNVKTYDAGSVTLQWNPANYSGSNAVEYTIAYKEADNANFITYKTIKLSQLTTSTTTDTEFTVTGLKADTLYTFEVTANVPNTGVTPLKAPIVSQKTQKAEIAIDWDGKLIANNITQDGALINWSAATTTPERAITYNLVYGSSATDQMHIDNISALNQALTNLTPDTTYNVTVTALAKDAGVSKVSPVLSFKTQSDHPSEDTWDSNKIYYQGDKVKYHGVDYQAKWWTQGDTPGQADVWENMTPYVPGSPWDQNKVYKGGEVVTDPKDNKQYKAQWYTQGGDSPSIAYAKDQYAVWRPAN